MTTGRRFAITMLLTTAAGCMRIVPDPDLPDLTVEWEDQCSDFATIRIEATSSDGEVVTVDAPCVDQEGRIEDLDRGSYTVVAAQVDAGGEVLGRAPPARVDLSDGVSRRIVRSQFVRLEGGFVTAAWSFTGDDGCVLLGVASLAVELSVPDFTYRLEDECEKGRLEAQFMASGVYPAVARAYGDDGGIVAESASQTVEVMPRGLTTDLTFDLARTGPR